VMEKARSGPLCIFQIDLFSARGDVPENLADVQQREKDIRYSSRTRLTTNRYRQLNDLSAAIDRLYDKLPPELKEDPDIAYLRASTPSHAVTLVHLIHRKQTFESASKDYEFSRLSMLDHWRAGVEDVRRTVEHPAWINRVPPSSGLTVFDLSHSHGI
ncbi:patatin-like phospholipase family protein, partial [Thioclava sp. BHET1]